MNRAARVFGRHVARATDETGRRASAPAAAPGPPGPPGPPRPPRPPEPPVEVAADAVADGDRSYAPGSARAALRYPTFRRIYFGAFLSNIGTWMQNVVLGALAYDLTGSSTFVGIVIFAQLGPMLLLSMVGGLLVDVLDRRRLLVTISLVQLVLSFVLAAVVAPGEPNNVTLVALVFALGIAQAFYAPAYAAILPQLVDREDLPGAISLNSVQMNASRVIGPVVGAFIDSLLGASAVFASNGVTYLFVVGAVLTVRLPPPAGRADGAENGVLRRLTSGFAVARRDPIVGRCLVTLTTFSLLSLAFIGQLPVVADRNLGIDERSGAYGALYACLGVGAVSGALAIGTVLSQRSQARISRVALVGFSVTLAVFALLRTPAPAYPVVIVLGTMYFALITSLSTIVQSRIDDHERGRVTALWIMGFAGTVPVGNLIAGPVIEATSVTTVLLVGAAWALALTAYARLDDHRAGAGGDGRAGGQAGNSGQAGNGGAAPASPTARPLTPG
ncbi:MAG TPA: MFS transporter [Acidimicrobiales bacterium]